MKINAKIIVILFLTGLMLSGCTNMLEPSGSQPPDEGTVLIRLAGSDARTLLPTAPPAFSRYSLSFNGISGQQPVNEIYDVSAGELTGSGKKVILGAGNWNVSLTAHTSLDGVAGMTGGDYPAARGSVIFAVVSGENNTPVTITVNPLTSEGEGVLSYRADMAAQLKVLTVTGAELSPSVTFTLAAGASGTRALPAGYYILQAESSARVTASVLHIYAGMTTTAILNSGFNLVQQAAAAGDANLRLRYEVNAAGTTFTATPSTGSSWNATLAGGASIVTINGRKVVDMGSNNGYIDLGANVGTLLQTLPNFSIETYIYIPFQNILKINDAPGHFIWSFSNAANAATAGARYMWLRAADQVFAITNSGISGEQKTDQKAGYFNGPLPRGIWKHVVLTRSSNTINLYVDGVLKGTRSTTVAYNDFGSLNYNYLARPGFNGDTYLKNAQYYRLSVYDKAFTQQEIVNNLGAKEIIAGFPHERILTKDVSVPMKHVGGLHTPEDFARIRAKLAANEEPWVSGYNQLSTNSHAQTGWSGPYPTEYIDRPGSGGNFMNAARSSAAAYMNGLLYHIGRVSNPTYYGDKAVYILNRWANENIGLSGDTNISLAAGLYGYMFAVAGELMRDYPGWEPADFAKYQQWLLNVFYPSNMDFLIRHHNCWDDHYWTNWDMCNLASMLAIGIVCDRRDIYNWAIEALQGNYGEPIGTANSGQRRVVGNGYWFKAINNVHITADGEELGQQQESGRDQGHAVMNIGLLGVICQLTWNQGDDFFGLGDNLFLKDCEYISKYNVAGLAVPFTTYTRLNGNGNSPARDTMTGVSPAARGETRPVWALPYYHYTVIKGVDPAKIRWTKLAMQITTPEWGPQMGNASGSYDQPGFGTLLYTR